MRSMGKGGVSTPTNWKKISPTKFFHLSEVWVIGSSRFAEDLGRHGSKETFR